MKGHLKLETSALLSLGSIWKRRSLKGKEAAGVKPYGSAKSEPGERDASIRSRRTLSKGLGTTHVEGCPGVWRRGIPDILVNASPVQISSAAFEARRRWGALDK